MRVRLSSTAGRASVLLAAVLSVPGCATKGDLRNVRDEIRLLTTRQDSLLAVLNRQARITQDSLRGTADQLFQIRGSLSQQLATILDELERIRELSGQNQRAIASVRDQLEAMRRQALLGTPMIEGGEPGGEAGGGAPEGMYNAAVVQFNRGSNTAARMAFEQFLQAYPDHELAPEARYKLADIMVQEERVQDAIRMLQTIPELHPTAPKVPDAIYRTGLLHLELGERQEARRAFERVINSYPDSPVVPMAERSLREMGRR